MFLMNYRIRFRSNLIFWILLLTVAWCYNYPEILSKGPYSIHQWRQADCLSITQNYYVEDRPFLEPAIHWVGESDGCTVSECPLIYYSVAQLWQWFGKQYWVFRLLNVLFVFLGLWSLFKLTLKITGSSFWAVFVPLFLFSSPILAFYSNNFLADAPAFGLALTGGYLAWLGVKEKRKWAYYLAFLVFLLAGLIKISSLIIFIALGLMHAGYAFRSGINKKLKHWTAWVPYLITGSILFAWYRYAHLYNQENLSGIFLTGLFPIWELGGKQVMNIWKSLTDELLPAYFIRQGLWLLGVLLVVVSWNFRKVQRFWLALLALVCCGIIGFLLLFYQAFTVHDYYLTNLLIFVPVTLLTFLVMGQRNFPVLLKNKWVRAVASMILCLLIYKTALTNRMKYSVEDPWLNYNYVVADQRIDFWRWFHNDYRRHKKAYETLSPYLRELGLDREDRILTFSDRSINITLYLMDQKGFSSFGYGAYTLEEKMKLYAKNEVDFIILDENTNDAQTLAPYLGKKIGQHENLLIYDFQL